MNKVEAINILINGLDENEFKSFYSLLQQNPKINQIVETESILIKMGFVNTDYKVWESPWKEDYVIPEKCTPRELAKMIFNDGYEAGGESNKAY